MDTRVKIPWIGGQNTMDRVVKIPCMDRGGKIPWVGGQMAMDRGSKYHG
jgi:hypothetical protein